MGNGMITADQEEAAKFTNQKLKEMPEEDRVKLLELVLDGICPRCGSLTGNQQCWGCYDSRGE